MRVHTHATTSLALGFMHHLLILPVGPKTVPLLIPVHIILPGFLLGLNSSFLIALEFLFSIRCHFLQQSQLHRFLLNIFHISFLDRFFTAVFQSLMYLEQHAQLLVSNVSILIRTIVAPFVGQVLAQLTLYLEHQPSSFPAHIIIFNVFKYHM